MWGMTSISIYSRSDSGSKTNVESASKVAMRSGRTKIINESKTKTPFVETQSLGRTPLTKRPSQSLQAAIVVVLAGSRTKA